MSDIIWSIIIGILLSIMVTEDIFSNELIIDRKFDNNITMACNDAYCSEHELGLTDEEIEDYHDIEYREFLHYEHLTMEIEDAI